MRAMLHSRVSLAHSKKAIARLPASRPIRVGLWIFPPRGTTIWQPYRNRTANNYGNSNAAFSNRTASSGIELRMKADLEKGWDILVDLHQRRRISLGEPGCFASTVFHSFHREVAERMLRRGQLRISWLDLDGRPAAAEYHFADSTATYAYQGGVDPDRLEEEPGRLSTILCLKHAIDEGHTCFDFLRGDEPYKAHWRATPRPTWNYRIIPKRRLARIRGHVLNVAGTLGDWARQAVELSTLASKS